MESVFSSRIRRKRLHFVAFFLLMLLILSQTVVWQSGQMQQAPMSLEIITSALRSKNYNLAEKNRVLIDAVKVRGITFTLTPEIVKELQNAGASPKLIEAIRQKSPKPPLPTPVITPTAVPTPIPTPIPTPTPSDPSVLYQKRGDEYAAKGEYDRAILFYDEAIVLNPKDAATYYKRGFAYHYKNNRDRALKDYKTAIQLKAELAAQPVLQCVSYNSAENDIPDKAIEECSKAINSASDFPLAYYIRGNAYHDKKDADRAIADYNKFIEFNPKNVLVYINRGDAFFDKKDYDRAAADYNKAIELDASNELAKKNLQRLQAEQSNVLANKQESSASSENPNPPQNSNIGDLKNRAITLVSPFYPPNAKRIGIQDKVTVQITIDKSGGVISAKATSGNALLRSAAETAARQSKFKPVTVGNQTVTAIGFIIYNFVLQ